jgi:type II secretory pathway component GspD/PulD (secretin)
MVPDGGTTVVGGALLDSEREEQDRTPGLSRVPLLGNLFKRKGVFRDSSEILFFITPRIFRPDFAAIKRRAESATECGRTTDNAAGAARQSAVELRKCSGRS